MISAPANHSPRCSEDHNICTSETFPNSSNVVCAREISARPFVPRYQLLFVRLVVLFAYTLLVPSYPLTPALAHGTSSQPTNVSQRNADSIYGSLKNIVEIVAGDAHSCARNVLGEVYCWGDNEFGQLGDGTTIDRSYPTLVNHLSGSVQSLMAGGNHTCALVATASKNLALTVTDSLERGSSTSSRADTGQIQPRRNGTNTLAFCWGSNSHGQLGIKSSAPITETSPSMLESVVQRLSETQVNHPIPQPVIGLPETIVSLAAGEFHTCALSDGGAVYCWGSNSHGQLGIGTLEEGTDPANRIRVQLAVMKEQPAQVVGLGGTLAGQPQDEHVYLIEAGGNHTCAATAEQMLCWGNNEFGQLGNGTKENQTEPKPIAGPSANVLAMGLGRLHTCVLASNGTPFCWGSNFYGQLGLGTDGFQTDTIVAARVKDVPQDLMSIVSHGNHTCAIRNNQESYCWGFNLYGQLGDETTENRNSPTSVSFAGRESLSQIVTGHNHTCGIYNSQSLCWGHNFSGQLGDGSREGRSRPGLVATPLARTFLSYVAQPDANEPTPTPIPPSWVRMGQGGLSVRAIEVVPNQNDATVLVGIVEPPLGSMGLYRTTIDDGCIYTNSLVAGELNGSVMDVEIHDNTGVLANFDTNFYYTVDSGLNWQLASSPTRVNPYSVAFDTSHGWFAGTNKGLYRSQDGGLSWNLVNDDHKDINIVKSVDGEIWVGTDKSGLFAFNPLNLQYRELTTMSASIGKQIWDIIVVDRANSSRDYFLAAATGVYQRVDGNNWVSIGGIGLAGVNARSLAIHPASTSSDSEQLYVGTSGNGVWRVSLDDTDRSQSITSVGWDPSITVRTIAYEGLYCQTILAGTDDGLWVLQSP